MEYLHPGVYVEEIPSGSKVIEQVSTTIACFVGTAMKGPVGEANRITSFTEYTDIHGLISSESDAMGFAIKVFFMNGGTAAYVCRLIGDLTVTSSGESSDPTAIDFKIFYSNVLSKIADISTIVVPGEHWAEDGTGNSILSETINHCENLKTRMLIIDPPLNFEINRSLKVSQMNLPSSPNCVLYYPWVGIKNPFYNVNDPLQSHKNTLIAPSALAAGVWSKIDNKRGVWKAPAGAEANLMGVEDLQYAVGNEEQGEINPLGVNCFRLFSGIGQVVWGMRTLAIRTSSDWRYIPVRRTANMIEQSIYQSTQWTVFELNDHRLWSMLKSSIGNFLNELFRSGAFQGEKYSDAYFVRCGLGETMTQGDIAENRVIIEIGFAPMKPAEFVIIRIQQKTLLP